MHSQGTEEGGTPPKQQNALPVHGLTEREGEGPPEQEGEGRAPPDQQRTLLAHGLQEMEEGEPPYQEGEGGGHPPSSNGRYLHKACRWGGRGEPPIIRGLPPQEEAGERR